MSGGSYNYLCDRYAHNIGEATGDLAEMLDRLRGLGYAPRATAATERVRRLLADHGRVLDEAIDAIKDVWHAVEWRDSSDWGDDQMRAAIDKFEKETTVKPTAKIKLGPHGTGSVVVDDTNIANAVTGLTVHTTPGRVTEAEVRLVVAETEFDAIVGVDDRTRAALLALGWTPPAEGTAP